MRVPALVVHRETPTNPSSPQVDLKIDDTFQLRQTGESTVYVTGTYHTDDDEGDDNVSGTCVAQAPTLAGFARRLTHNLFGAQQSDDDDDDEETEVEVRSFTSEAVPAKSSGTSGIVCTIVLCSDRPPDPLRGHSNHHRCQPPFLRTDANASPCLLQSACACEESVAWG